MLNCLFFCLIACALKCELQRKVSHLKSKGGENKGRSVIKRDWGPVYLICCTITSEKVTVYTVRHGHGLLHAVEKVTLALIF